MTRIIQSGWESGDVAQAGSASLAGSGGALPAVVSAVPAARSGTYCLKCALGPSGTGTGFTTHFSRLTLAHASLTEVWYAFGLYVVHGNEPGGPNFVFAHAVDAGSGNVNVVLTTDSGIVRAYGITAGTTSPLTANGTLLGTAGAALSGSAWHLIEVRLVASTGAGGTCEVYADGAQIINATGARTAQTSATYGALVLGTNNWGSALSGFSHYHAFDDARINSTAGALNNGRPGNEAIRLIVPNGPGDLTQLSRGGTDSGNNWDQCDEVPASTAEYVTGAGAGLTDLYHTTDLAPTSVSAVNVLALASNPAGGGTVALVTKTPAGSSTGTAVALQTTWGWTQRLLETDPSGGAAWDSAKLSALQLGVSVG